MFVGGEQAVAHRPEKEAFLSGAHMVWLGREVNLVNTVSSNELTIAHTVAHHKLGFDVVRNGDGVKSPKVFVGHDEAVPFPVWASRQNADCMVEDLKVHEIVSFTIEFLIGGHSDFLQMIVLFPHPEADVDGIALQLLD